MNGDRLTFTNLLTSIPRNMEIDASSSDVCRLCAENYDKRFCYPLYDENKRERTIAKQINQLVVNLVSPDDGLPQKICFKCSKNVEMCYSFVCNVIETQNKLKRLKSVTDQKQKRSSGEDFIEKCRLENGTSKDYDNGLNNNAAAASRRNISKSSPYPKIINNGQDSNSIEIDRENDVSTINPGRASFSPRQSQSQNQSSQVMVNGTSTKSKTVPCLYRCGVCLEKFPTKDECLRHMMSSHTPPPNVFPPNEPRKSVSFDVVCKNTAAEKAAQSNPNVLLVRDDANNSQPRSILKNKQPQPEMEISPMSGKSRARKVLAIDSFYREMKKSCVRFECAICGRLMVSTFAFRRHMRQHREETKEQDSPESSLHRSMPSVTNAKPVVGYCKICSRLVKNFRRHNMYHSIVKLESDNPNFGKKLPL